MDEEKKSGNFNAEICFSLYIFFLPVILVSVFTTMNFIPENWGEFGDVECYLIFKEEKKKGGKQQINGEGDEKYCAYFIMQCN